MSYRKNMKSVEKALTFRASSIGDCLMGKYFLENIHTQYPQARCGIVVAGKSAMLRDLFKGDSWLEIIEANRRNPAALLRLWQEWRKCDVVSTQYAGKAGGSFGLLSKLAARLLARRGALIGFKDAARGTAFLYDHLLPFNPDVAPAEHERQALRAVGFSVPLAYPTLEAVPDPAVLKLFGVESDRFVLVNLFSGSEKRGLSPARQRALILSLSKQLPGVPLLVTGGPQDREAAAEATARVSNAQVVAGISLEQTIQLALQAHLTVSLDTGVAHIAAHMRRPLIVLSTCMGLFWWGEDQYGPGIPQRVFSAAEHCRSGHIMAAHPVCLNAIDMDVVGSAAATI